MKFKSLNKQNCLDNNSKMIRNVDDDEKGTNIIHTPGGNQQVWMLTENGLYEVLMQSRKPIAKEFKKGVKAILKEIRKNGGYIATRKEDTPEEIMARALILANATIERQKKAIEEAEEKASILNSEKKELKKEIDTLLPRATFAKAVEKAENSILVGELSCILRQNGIETGTKRLFKWLREKRYLCSRGMRFNQPTQMSMNLGLFEIKKTRINKPNGDTLVKTTTKVTGKGQVYFVNKFLNK